MPTQLIFGLSALKIHGYEVVSLRYFKIDDHGSLHYLDDADLATAPDVKKGKPELRNRLFANAELQFRRPGGRIQIYRHVRANLGNDDSPGIGPGLKTDPRVLVNPEAMHRRSDDQGGELSVVVGVIFAHARLSDVYRVVWMVSDATGIAPKWGKPAFRVRNIWSVRRTAHRCR